MALGWLQPGRVCRNVFVQGERPAAAVGPWRGGASGDTEGTGEGWGAPRSRDALQDGDAQGAGAFAWHTLGCKGRGSGDVQGMLVCKLICELTCAVHTHTHSQAGVSVQPWLQGVHTPTPSPVLPSIPAPFWGTHNPKARCACSRVGIQAPKCPSHPALFHCPVALEGMSWVQGAPRDLGPAPQEGSGCWSSMEEEEEARKGCWRRRRLGGAPGVPGQSQTRMLARMCWRGQAGGGGTRTLGVLGAVS